MWAFMRNSENRERLLGGSEERRRGLEVKEEWS
jgi:hypothetical protein